MENAKMKGLRAKINKAVLDFNGAIGDSSLPAMYDAKTDINELLKQYKDESFDCFIGEIKKAENPLIEAVTRLEYDGLRFKEKKENGVVTDGSIEEVKLAPDMVKVCERLGLSTTWQYDVEAYARLISLRAAKDIECKDADIKELGEKFRMSAQARKMIHEGKDPTSNNQLVKGLQDLSDKVFGQVGKVNNKDLAYVRECFTKKGKEKGTVGLGTGRLMHNLFAEVVHNIITGDAYRVAYKQMKEKKAPEAPKTETETVTVPDEHAA